MTGPRRCFRCSQENVSVEFSDVLFLFGIFSALNTLPCQIDWTDLDNSSSSFCVM